MADNISKTFELIGRFCPWSTYLPIIQSGLKGELSQNDEYIKCSVQALACLVKGNLEALPEGKPFLEKKLVGGKKYFKYQNLTSFPHIYIDALSSLLRCASANSGIWPGP